MKYFDRIIVLSTTPFRDKSLVLHCLSSRDGRCALLVRNAVGAKAFLQPLAVLECEVSQPLRSSMKCAKDFSNCLPLNGIRRFQGKNAISMFISEVLFRSLQEGTLEEGLFDWCESQIMLLNGLEKDYANFHIRFLLDYAAALGFKASEESLLPFAEDSAGSAIAFLNSDFAQAMLIPMNGEKRALLCERILKYLEFHLETPLNIRSLGILSELFANFER